MDWVRHTICRGALIIVGGKWSVYHGDVLADRIRR